MKWRAPEKAEYMRIDDFASVIGLTPAQLKSAIRSGKAPEPPHAIGRHKLYPVDWCEQFVNEKKWPTSATFRGLPSAKALEEARQS